MLAAHGLSCDAEAKIIRNLSGNMSVFEATWHLELRSHLLQEASNPNYCSQCTKPLDEASGPVQGLGNRLELF